MVQPTPQLPQGPAVAETYRKLLLLILKFHRELKHGGSQDRK